MAINSLSTLTEFPSLWSQNGSSIYYNSGNLGIGLSNPGSELDVVGDINFSGNLLQNGVIMTFGQFDTDGDGTSIVYNNGGEVVLDKIRSNTLGDGVFTIRDCTNSTGKWQNRIGTDDSYNLDYYNGSSWSNCVFVDTIGLNVNATSGKRLSIRNASGISNNEDLGGVSWMQEGSTGTVVGNIFMLGDSDGGTTGRGKMFFGVRGNDSNQSAICQMSLDSFGNVNIGGDFTSSSKLYVGKTSWGINEANPLVNFAVTASGTNGSGSYTSRIMKLYSDGSFTSEVDNGDNIIGLEIEMDVTGPVNKIPLRIIGDNNYNYDFTSQSDGVTPGRRLDMFVGSSGGEFSFTNSGGELLRIKGDGNVGIGDDSPAYPLVVKRDLDTGGVITRFFNSDTTYSQTLDISFDSAKDITFEGGSGAGGLINNFGTNGYVWQIGGSEKARITSDGNVGINQNNPTIKLEVVDTNNEILLLKQTAGPSSYMTIGPNNNTGAKIGYDNTDSADLVTIGHHTVGNVININSSGKVGIGETDPDSHHVAIREPRKGNVISHGAIQVSSTATTIDDRVGIVFNQTDVISRGRAAIMATAEQSGGYGSGLSFFTRYAVDGTTLQTTDERMRITSAGLVGIGTDSPSSLAHVYNGTLQIGSKTGDTSLQDNPIAIRIAAIPNESTEWGGIQWYREFSDLIGAAITAARPDTSESRTDLIFKTTNSGTDAVERMRINHSGNVGIGVSPQARLHVAGDNDTEVIRVGGAGDAGGVQGSAYIGISHWKPTSTQTYSPIRIGAKEIGVADYRADLIFETRDVNSDSAPVERMRIAYNGEVKTTNLAFVGSSIENYTTANDSGNVWVNYEGYNGGTTYFRDFKIGNGKQTPIAWFCGSTGSFGLGSSAPTYLFDMGTGNARNIRVGTRTFIGSGYSGSSTILGYNVIADESTTATNRMIITETSTGNGLPAAINMFAGNMEFHTAPSGTINDEMSCLRLRIINAGTVEIYNAADPDGTDDSLRIYAQDGDSRFTVGNNGTNHSAVMKLSNSGGTITHCLNSHGGFACHNGCVKSPTVCGSTIVKTKTLCVCEGTVGSAHPRILLNMDACKTDVGSETATCFRVSVNAEDNCSIIYTGDTANNAAVLCTTAAHFRACGPIGTQSCFCGKQIMLCQQGAGNAMLACFIRHNGVSDNHFHQIDVDPDSNLVTLTSSGTNSGGYCMFCYVNSNCFTASVIVKSPVLCATSCSYVGQSRLGAGFSTYTNDGLFDSNAKPSSIGLSNASETIMGYYSTGNGFYWGRMGHRSQADSGNTYGTLDKIYCQSWGARSANTFSVEIEGSDKLVVNKDSVCLCVDLISNPIGLYNVILGPNNFGNSTTGSTSNVVVADGAALGVTDTDNSVFIGKGSGGVSGINTELQTGTGNVFIGYGAGPAAAASSYEVVIGGDYAVGKGTQTSFLAPNSGAYQGNNSASWSTTSDERLKKNIVDNYQGIELINQIRVRNFEYRIEDEIDDDFKQQRIQREGVQVGVIAQELQEVFPDAVTEQSSGLLSVDNDELFWYMINAIKQLNARVEQLETQTQ